jgi:hypothetical protein
MYDMSTMLSLHWGDNKGCQEKLKVVSLVTLGTYHFIVNSSMGDVRSWKYMNNMVCT